MPDGAGLLPAFGRGSCLAGLVAQERGCAGEHAKGRHTTSQCRKRWWSLLRRTGCDVSGGLLAVNTGFPVDWASVSSGGGCLGRRATETNCLLRGRSWALSITRKDARFSALFWGGGKLLPVGWRRVMMKWCARWVPPLGYTWCGDRPSPRKKGEH